MITLAKRREVADDVRLERSNRVERVGIVEVALQRGHSLEAEADRGRADQREDLVAPVREPPGDVAADESGCSGDEDAQGSLLGRR